MGLKRLILPHLVVLFAVLPLSARLRDKMAFTLTSPAFAAGAPIPSRPTCDGEDLSPALAWTSAPKGTQGFALVMQDPDAPMGTWVHWVAWNMPETAKGLPEAVPPQEKLSDGTRQGLAWGVDRFSRVGYGGPCPPSGTHHYHFVVYALDRALELKPKADVVALRKAMQGHILAEADLVGTYSRK